MKILILYHSGAGSTKVIAEIYYTLLSHHKTEIYPIDNFKDFEKIGNCDFLLFAFPTYHCSPSRSMTDFLERVPNLSISKKAFVFTTYGLYTGNTLRIFAQECRKKNIQVVDFADYKSPATDGVLLFPSFRFMFKYEKRIGVSIKKDIQRIEKLLSDTKTKRKIPCFKLYSILNYPNKRIALLHKPNIEVRTEVCVLCNICVDNCLRKCFNNDNGIIRFTKTNCESCYKCIHHCPKEALILSSKTVGKPKFNKVFYKTLQKEILQEIAE